MTQSLADIDLGGLLTQVSGDAEALKTLVIYEIEHSLPNIISSLKIPPPIEKHRLQVFEFRLAGKPGFRRLNSDEREKIAQQLQKETFLRSLRRAQEAFLNGVHAGTIKHGAGISADQAEGSRVVADPFSQSMSTTYPQAPEVASEVKEQADFMDVPATAHDLQGALPFETSDSLLAKTVRDYEERPELILEIPDIPIELQEPLANRDIRDLIALFKGGRLVGFLDVVVDELIPRNIEKIRVPRRNTYAALNLENLIAAYHDLAVTDLITRDLADELRLLDALIASIENEEQWARINTRRFHLINKKHSIGLQSEEVEELDALDALAEKQMHAVQQLPFAELAMLKTYARRLGFEEDAG